jgi:hypothetical protein
MSSTQHPIWALRAVFAVALFCILSAHAPADILHVPGEYATIQAAIDAAEPGDEVVVSDGTYTGAGNKNLDFAGKAITVRGESGDPDLCIIDCEEDGRAFHLHSGEPADARIESLTIRNGLALGNQESFGGAVVCENGSSVSIDRCIFMDNTAKAWDGDAWGGAISCGTGTVTITDCRFAQNIVYTECYVGAGNAVHNNGGTLRLIACVFEMNTGGMLDAYGGAVCNSGGELSATDCRFINNHAAGFCDGAGGAICNEGTLTLLNCEFIGNKTGGGGCGGMGRGWGGAVWHRVGTATIVNCTFEDNYAFAYGDWAASPWGGALCIYSWGAGEGAAPRCGTRRKHPADAQTLVVNCVFCANEACDEWYDWDGKGGAICDMEGSLTAVNCTMVGNIASDGGGIWTGYADSAIANTIVWGNIPDQIDADEEPTVTYSDVQYGYAGEGNIDADPLFTEPDDEMPLCLRSPDGGSWEYFGRWVAAEGDVVVIGEPEYGLPQFGPAGRGAAYVYRYHPGSGAWEYEAQLLPFGPDEGILFGDQVTIDGDVIVVGAPGWAYPEGRVFVYRYDPETSMWLGEQVLASPNGPADSSFGDRLDVGGGVISAHAMSGYHYLYRYDAQSGQWNFEQQILSAEGGHWAGVPSVDGDRVVYGYDRNDDLGENAGTALVYEYDYDTSTWILTARLYASDAAENDYFGSSVDLVGDFLAIGANDESGADEPGTVYIFHMTGESWEEVAMIAPHDGSPGDEFGDSVAFDGTTLVVGADPSGPAYGAYVFDFNQSTYEWSLRCELEPTGEYAWAFGCSVALADPWVVVGDAMDYEFLMDAGAAYIFDLAGPDGPGDLDGGISANSPSADRDDDDLRLPPDSPCIDAADNEAVPPDVLDLDGDGDTEEPIPFDLDGNLRFVDDPETEDTGHGNPPIVDMGAYEFQPPECPADFDGDGDVDTADLLFLLAAWGTADGDVDGDGDTDTADLLALLADWGECP